MNNATVTTNGNVDKTFNSFPTIKIGHSYKLQIGTRLGTGSCGRTD